MENALRDQRMSEDIHGEFVKAANDVSVVLFICEGHKLIPKIFGYLIFGHLIFGKKFSDRIIINFGQFWTKFRTFSNR